MKKKLSLLLSFLLSIVLMYTPAYACEKEQEKDTISGVSTSRDVDVLWSTDPLWFIDHYDIYVTPTQGKKLKIIITASDICGIKVFKSGSTSPVYTGIYQAGSGTQILNLVNYCDGGQYTIKLINNSGVTVVAMVTQSDY